MTNQDNLGEEALTLAKANGQDSHKPVPVVVGVLYPQHQTTWTSRFTYKEQCFLPMAKTRGIRAE